MGLIKIILSVVGLLVGLLVIMGAIAGVFYATDSPVQANVTDQSCSFTGTNTVSIVTEFPVPGIPYTTEVDAQACAAVLAMRSDGEDPWVQYFLKSEVVEIYEDHPDKGGALIYRG